MHLLTRNVNTGFRSMVGLFADGRDGRTDRFFRGVNPVRRRSSRNGPVLVIDEPVVMTYSHPTERVLLNQARNANPFFHLYEALWMLAGHDDVASLAHYVPKVAEYSDDGSTFNGAYGRRWRRACPTTGYAYDQMEDGNGPPRSVERGVDQLDVLIDHLTNKPDSRRAVLQMWNVEEDLLRVGGLSYQVADGQTTERRVNEGSKDVCCNTEVMFSMSPCPLDNDGDGNCRVHQSACPRYLDMTVINRSNDLVWGTYGSDFMTFSILQEYMAARLGWRVGQYHHVSNNLHAYEANFTPERWLADKTPDAYTDPGRFSGEELVPLVSSEPDTYDELMRTVVRNNDGRERQFRLRYPDAFLDTVAQPMFDAYYHYRRKDVAAALEDANKIGSADWRFACVRWLDRRTSP